MNELSDMAMAVKQSNPDVDVVVNLDQIITNNTASIRLTEITSVESQNGTVTPVVNIPIDVSNAGSITTKVGNVITRVTVDHGYTFYIVMLDGSLSPQEVSTEVLF